MGSSNVTSATNHFPRANEGFITTLGSGILSGATTVPLNSVAGLTDTSIFVGIIEPGLAKEQTFTGVVDTGGTQITGVVWTRGSNADHSLGVTIVDYVSGTSMNLLEKGLSVEHEQDGTHKAITTPSIVVDDAGTLDVDTINEATAAAGVSVDGLAIKDSKLVTADSVVAANITDGIVANAHLDTTTGELGGAWDDWTPTWGNLGVTGSTVVAKYTQVGKTVKFMVEVVLGGGDVPTGTVTLDLPINAAAYLYTNGDVPIGMVTGLDAGSATHHGQAFITGADVLSPKLARTTSPYQTLAITATQPFTWTNTDTLSITGEYEVA